MLAKTLREIGVFIVAVVVVACGLTCDMGVFPSVGMGCPTGGGPLGGMIIPGGIEGAMVGTPLVTGAS